LKSRPVTTLKKGEKGTIINFTNVKIASKLISMGVLPGSPVKVMMIAPFHGGFYLKVNGQNIALRFKEAETVMIRI